MFARARVQLVGRKQGLCREWTSRMQQHSGVRSHPGVAAMPSGRSGRARRRYSSASTGANPSLCIPRPAAFYFPAIDRYAHRGEACACREGAAVDARQLGRQLRTLLGEPMHEYTVPAAAATPGISLRVLSDAIGSLSNQLQQVA